MLYKKNASDFNMQSNEFSPDNVGPLVSLGNQCDNVLKIFPIFLKSGKSDGLMNFDGLKNYLYLFL